MPHLRPRFLSKHLQKALKLSPIVGVIGQRQVGKSTIVESEFAEDYRTLDDEQTLIAAQNSPMQFLAGSAHTLVIDECQRAPKLFPALKLYVQKNKRFGQFLLTGSVRFTARKIIQESLTGRIINLELLPLTIAEMCRLPIQNTITSGFHESVTNAKMNSLYADRIKTVPADIFIKFLSRGGLPSFWFLRDFSFLKIKFKSHLETLLQRDLQLIVQTTVPFENLLELLRYLALHQGEPINLTSAARSSQIAINTLKKLIFAYENMFLIRRVNGMDYGKASVFYLEDQGMASYLSASTPMQDMLRFAFSQLFASIHYQEIGDFDVKYYSTKGGAHVPLVFRFKNKIHGYILSESSEISSKSLSSAESFLKKHPHAHVTILVKNTTHFEKLGKGILKAPLLAVI